MHSEKVCSAVVDRKTWPQVMCTYTRATNVFPMLCTPCTYVHKHLSLWHMYMRPSTMHTHTSLAATGTRQLDSEKDDYERGGQHLPEQEHQEIGDVAVIAFPLVVTLHTHTHIHMHMHREKMNGEGTEIGSEREDRQAGGYFTLTTHCTLLDPSHPCLCAKLTFWTTLHPYTHTLLTRSEAFVQP